MSLKSISEYCSETESEDSVASSPPKKLPRPLFNSNFISFCSPEPPLFDDQESHFGRKRSFPHERGNWASLIYLHIQTCDELEKFTTLVEQEFINLKFEKITDLHISLSKTFVLRYHWLETFATTLKDYSAHIPSIQIILDRVKIYTNDEKTRTFIAVAVSALTDKVCKWAVSFVDKVLLDYKLPTYYKEPSFHVSVLSVTGDSSETLKVYQEKLQSIFSEHCKEVVFNIEEIHLKTGNKLYTYPLNN